MTVLTDCYSATLTTAAPVALRVPEDATLDAFASQDAAESDEEGEPVEDAETDDESAELDGDAEPSENGEFEDGSVEAEDEPEAEDESATVGDEPAEIEADGEALDTPDETEPTDETVAASESADSEAATVGESTDESTVDISEVEPARSTYDWTPDGGECADCGASAERRWRADGQKAGELVCEDCKEW